ncbi:MAG TPA: hypothetical protein VGP03_01570 [Pseudonocardiaceae bacterium]|nr:hypothetical protein [Pseudonocardiaceae bacterium]
MTQRSVVAAFLEPSGDHRHRSTQVPCRALHPREHRLQVFAADHDRFHQLAVLRVEQGELIVDQGRTDGRAERTRFHLARQLAPQCGHQS